MPAVDSGAASSASSSRSGEAHPTNDLGSGSVCRRPIAAISCRNAGNCVERCSSSEKFIAGTSTLWRIVS